VGPYLKIKIQTKEWVCVQEVGCLPTKHEALGSILRTIKKEKISGSEGWRKEISSLAPSPHLPRFSGVV
jgi:hypothetical protein